LDEYTTDLKAQGLTVRTVENYASSIRKFFVFLGPKRAEETTLADLRNYLTHLSSNGGLSPKTIGRDFSAITSFFQFLEFEERITGNPVPKFRRRYLRTIQREAEKDVVSLRQLIEVDDMRRLVQSIIDVRDRAIVVLLAKTGIRREELTSIDIGDIDWKAQSIQLKKKRKRTNTTVFFDDETARLLQHWIAIRRARGAGAEGPLFTNGVGNRADRNDVYNAVTEAAKAAGLHKPGGRLKDKFTPHCCRHFFTTHLSRAGMAREYIAWLRGDAPAASMDIYLHIDPKAVRESYRAKIPQFGL
jgi:integrase/recombinase XerD